MTLAKLKYAKRYGNSFLDLRKLDQLLQRVTPIYYASGFDHPDLPVITNERSDEVRMLNWGLIPFWTKNAADVVKIQNQTLNARSETIFEKPAFKESVRERRCLIIVDGFYEHHHENKKTFPHHILRKDREPVTLAGVWDIWRGNGMERTTVSIVTTWANKLMERIHNNPKTSDGPRMPVILSQEKEKDWLTVDGEDQLKKLMVPFDEYEMEAYTVPRLKGKHAVGNNESAISKYDYPELSTIQTGLF
ncbi:MAG TPA: SOS response-associated peptidase [Cyclobacteriaceae bacterium]